MSPHLPKRGRVQLHVRYPISYAHGRQKSSRGSGKRNERDSLYSPSLSWEITWRRHGTLIGRNRSACRCETLHTAGSSFVFIFRALRPCDQNSPISVWKPVYLLRAFVYAWMADAGQWREIQLGIHSFIRKENTPFWRERHVRIPDHLCV